MKQFLATWLDRLIGILFVVTVLFFGFLGWAYGEAAGSSLVGALIGLVAGFVLGVLTYGLVAAILDIRAKLYDIDRALAGLAAIKRSASQSPAHGSGGGAAARSQTSILDADPHHYSVKYKGRTIHHNNKEFVVENQTFSSIDEAKAFIDRMS